MLTQAQLSVLPDLSGVTESMPGRVVGTVKWFDPTKSYGFIASKDNQDILIHYKCLARAGFTAIQQGATVICETVSSQRGLQVSKLVSIDNSTAVVQPITEKRSQEITNIEGPVESTIKWFDRTKGFGFISQKEGAPDIFIHMETLKRCGITDPQSGQTVYVTTALGPKGPLVVHIQMAKPEAEA